MENKRIYQRVWFVISAVVLVPPVGICLMWYHKSFGKSVRIVATFFASVYTLFIAIFFSIADRPGDQVTLQQAKYEAGYTIFMPSYLPENTKLLTVRWLNGGSKEYLYLGFIKDDYPLLEITETSLKKEQKASGSAPVDISGNQGYIIKQLDTTRLTWNQKNTTLTITAEKLNQDELLKIARSVKAYGE